MSRNKTYPPKEFVWTLELDGEEKIWRCVVGDTECVTYEGDVEKKHLKIMTPERKQKVLQIDTTTVVYGRQTPFQLENGVPYIQIDGEWIKSDTSIEDRLNATIHMHVRTSHWQVAAGLALFAVALARQLITGEGDWWMLTVFGTFCILSAVMRRVRLRDEVAAYRQSQEEERQKKERIRAIRQEKAESTGDA